MGKKTNILMPVFAILLVVVFCLTAKTSFAMSTAPGIYHFFGRVMNQEDKPVGSCSLLLIKRMAQKEEKQKTEAGQTEEKQYGCGWPTLETCGTGLQTMIRFVFENLQVS